MLPDDHHCGQGVSLSRSVPTDELAVFEHQADAVKVYVVMVCFFVVHIIVLLNDVCWLLALNNKRASLVRRAPLSKEAWRIVSCGRKVERTMEPIYKNSLYSLYHKIGFSYCHHVE